MAIPRYALAARGIAIGFPLPPPRVRYVPPCTPAPGGAGGTGFGAPSGDRLPLCFTIRIALGAKRRKIQCGVTVGITQSSSSRSNPRPPNNVRQKESAM